MFGLIRNIILGKRVKLSQSAAVEIAKNTCNKKNYQWTEPVNVILFRGIYSIRTNYGFIGNNFLIKVDGQNGEVLEFTDVERKGP